MTSDVFVAFWRSVQNIPNIKSSHIGPVLEQLMGPKCGCSDFRRILPFNLGLCFLFYLINIISFLVERKDLVFFRVCEGVQQIYGLAVYSFEVRFILCNFEDRQKCQGFGDFLLEGVFNPFLNNIFYDFNYEYAELISFARAKP